MPDREKKLDALLKTQGLMTGAEWARKREAQPEQPPEDDGQDAEKTQPPSPTPTETVRTLTQRLGLMTGSQYVHHREEVEAQREAGDFEIDQVVDGKVVGDDEAGFFLVRRDFPLDYQQGIVTLGAALASSSKHIAFSAADPGLEDFDPRTTLFIDTETTGLAGGAGTVAFLVGVGYFIEDAFRLDQCFLRDYDDEAPMLDFLAERFADHDTVVGYNSKSFDLPLLRTRFIQNRVPFRLDAILHYDLVHAARRFWKRRLSDCSLGNIEREVLGIHRQGDVPSYLIPQLWLDYLDTRDARPLEGVLYHHRMDILSLVSLTAWLSQCLDAPAGDGFAHVEDRLSLVRLHFKQRQYEAVIQHGDAFLEAEDRGPLRRECLEMMGIAYKRLQRWPDMQAAFERLLDEFPGDITACLELAKHHEHRTRNLLEAERLCTRLLDRAEITLALDHGATPLSAQAQTLRRRLDRIRRKLSKGRPRTIDPE